MRVRLDDGLVHPRSEAEIVCVDDEPPHRRGANFCSQFLLPRFAAYGKSSFLMTQRNLQTRLCRLHANPNSRKVARVAHLL